MEMVSGKGCHRLKIILFEDYKKIASFEFQALKKVVLLEPVSIPARNLFCLLLT